MPAQHGNELAKKAALTLSGEGPRIVAVLDLLCGGPCFFILTAANISFALVGPDGIAYLPSHDFHQ